MFLFYFCRMREGLNLAPFHVLREMEANPKAMEKLFIASEEPLTVEAFVTLFDVRWSPQGSNRRRPESITYGYLHTFLEELEGKKLSADSVLANISFAFNWLKSTYL